MDNYPLMQVASDLRDADDYLNSAMRHVIPETVDDEEIEQFFLSCPEYREMYDRIGSLRQALEQLWPTKILEYLREEKERYHHDLDQWDAQANV